VSGVLAAWARFTVRRPGRALLLVLIVTLVAAATAAARIARDGPPLDFTPQALFMDGGPEFDRMARIEREFGREDNDVMLLLEGDIGTPEGVDAIRALHAAMIDIPGVERVESLVTATVMSGEDGLLLVDVPLDDMAPAEALKRVSADPLLHRLLVSDDGRVTAVVVRIKGDRVRVAELEPVVDAIAEKARAVSLPDNMALHLAGVPWVRVEVVDLMTRSQLVYLPIVGTLFALAMAIQLRRIGLAFAPLMTVLVADVWVVGVLVGMGLTLNVLSILVPTLVVVIGVADGIHIVGRYREELGSGSDREGALGRTMAVMGLPCFLTTFTTAAGFVSLLVAETSVIRSFGLQCAIAMVITFVGVVTVLPALLAWIPADRIPAKKTADAPPWGDRLLLSIDRGVRRRPWTVIALTGMLTMGAAALGSSVGTNSGLLEMYREGMPTWEAIRLAETRLSGVVPVMVYMEGEPDSMLQPEMLARMDAVEAAMRAEPTVRWTLSPASVVRRIHEALTQEHALPSGRALVAQELLVVDISGERPLEPLVNDDRSTARIQALLTDAGGRVYLPLQARIEAAAAEAFAGTNVRVAVTGDGFLAASGVDRLIGDLLKSVGLVFVIVTITFAVLLRDLKLAAIAAVPNLVPLVFTLATLRLMGADLQTSNIVSFTVAVGLAVDDSIHFLARYRMERQQGRPVGPAITRTYLGAGRAIVVTSVLLVIGFGVLGMDDLTSTRHFGILSSVTMVAALLGDLFLLPALLHLVEVGAQEGAAPTTRRGIPAP
jgi:uncharacterized protein